jgi:hypothetical protein
MEIEFEPGRTGKPNQSQPVARPTTTRRECSSDAPFQNAGTVKTRLRVLPSIRPEKVRRAKALISDVEYPPNEMLAGIANLLAMHIK